jgi:hypothetical protein
MLEQSLWWWLQPTSITLSELTYTFHAAMFELNGARMTSLKDYLLSMLSDEDEAKAATAEAVPTTLEPAAEPLLLTQPAEEQPMTDADNKTIATVFSTLFGQVADLTARLDAISSQPAFDATQITGYTPPVVTGDDSAKSLGASQGMSDASIQSLSVDQQIQAQAQAAAAAGVTA